MADPVLRVEPRLSPGGPITPDMRPDATVRLTPPVGQMDGTTILALVLSLVLIFGAIAMGDQNANFLDIPSVMIVILGTVAVTCISYTGRELRLAGPMMASVINRTTFDPTALARELLDVTMIARKRGVLQLGNYVDNMNSHPFLANTLQMVSDGIPAADIDRLAHQEIDMMLDGYKKAAGMLRRASDGACPTHHVLRRDHGVGGAGALGRET
jgi:chemotaxis protein MotA